MDITELSSYVVSHTYTHTHTSSLYMLMYMYNVYVYVYCTLIIKPTRCTNFSYLFFIKRFYHYARSPERQNVYCTKEHWKDRRFIVVETSLYSNTIHPIPEEAKSRKTSLTQKTNGRTGMLINPFSWYRRQRQWVIGSRAPDNKICSSLRA